MPTYKAHYSTGDYGVLWFEADSLEHGQMLLDAVTEGVMDVDNLPEVNMKSKADENIEIYGIHLIEER
tara:strand:- start:1572 stop:1775 length:204 start_codon:yes stop_codon:yes gene_type:complete